MKKLLFIALIAAFAVPAMAAPTVKLTGDFPGATMNFYTDSSGNTLDTSMSQFNGAITFCLEGPVSTEDRTYYPNTPYEYTIDDEVKYGGTSSDNPVPATLFDNTKKIYSAFLNNDSVIASMSKNDIQDKIWYSQISETNQDSFVNSLTNISGWENVKVLNLWNYVDGEVKPEDIQSQLIRVPAPGAILLAGMGTVFAGWIKRRRMLN